MDSQDGTLIEFRNRPWVVQQSGEDELYDNKAIRRYRCETSVSTFLSMGMNYRFIPTIFVVLQLMTSGKNSYKASAKVLYNAVYRSEI